MVYPINQPFNCVQTNELWLVEKILSNKLFVYESYVF